MSQKQKDIKNIIFPLIGIIVLVAAYFLVDFNKILQSAKGEAQFITQKNTCDLHKTACLIKIQDGTSFELDIQPKTIPLMETMKFSLKSNRADLEDLHINIYATNMFMGEFNIPFKNLGNGNYEALVTLPTCPVGDMQWNGDIRIEKLNKIIGARFQFKTDI